MGNRAASYLEHDMDVDPDMTWYLPGELMLWEKRVNKKSGISMFFRRPEFEEKDM